MAPYTPTTTAFDLGQEALFTIYEMAPGEGGISAMAGIGSAVGGGEDYTFTEDFDLGGPEYGVDENVLDLSEAEAQGFGPASSAGPAEIPESADHFDFTATGMGGMDTFTDDIGPDDFELDLSDMESASLGTSAGMVDSAAPEIAPELDEEPSLDIGTEPEISLEPETAEMAAGPETVAEPEVEAALDSDFGGSGFDSEVEGLGFGFDEEPTGETTAETDVEEEISLEPEAETAMEPELELADEQAEEPSLELSEEPELEMGDIDTEEPELEMGDIGEEESELLGDTDLDATMEETAELEEEDAGGIEFDLDSVDLDAPAEEVFSEEPEEDTGAEETPLDFEGMELEMESPEEPEEEEKP